MNVGERIRAARKQAGMTLEEVADKLGIAGQSVAQWETGRRKPKYGTLQRIADALQIPIESLLLDQMEDGYKADSLKLEEARMEREAQFNKDMDDLRKIQKERDKILLEADKAALEAIQAALEIIKSLQEEEEEKSVVAIGAADLGRAIAALRESMNQKHYPTGHGWMA